MKRRGLTLAVLLLFILSVQVHGAWYSGRATPSLSFTGTTAYCSGRVSAEKGEDIEVTYSVPASETSAIHFYNLNSSHGYYFGFTNDADYASVNTMWGHFTVSHSNPNF